MKTAESFRTDDVFADMKPSNSRSRLAAYAVLLLELHLVDVTAVVGGVGDSVSGNVVVCRNPAHPHHAVCDQWKLKTYWWGQRHCGGKRR